MTMIRFPSTTLPALLLGLLLACGGARAQGDSRLVALINDYRAHPDACTGSRAPLPPLRAHAALARVRMGAGAFPESVLERAGYYAANVEVIGIRGAADAAAVMETIRRPYCRALLNASLTEIGVQRSADEWTIVLARPLEPITLPSQDEAGQQILEAVNVARASPRLCGQQSFAAAGPVRWNAALAAAALAHSRDMAAHRHFAHRGTDGSEAAQRATRAGYSWRTVGENIAAGQNTAKEAVAGWLDSPGHCANLMNPVFTEMGAGYEISRTRMPGYVYWTQVFGVPR